MVVVVVLLGVCLDPSELSAPVPREHPAPIVNRAKRLRVQPIHRLPALAPREDQPDVSQHLQVLRHRGLTELEGVGDIGHRSLVAGDELEDVSTPRFRDRIEGIRGRRGARHEGLYIPI